MQTVLLILLWILRVLGGLLGLILLLLLLILFCKTKLDLSYRDGQPRLRLRFLFLHYTLFPHGKKKEKTEKQKKKSAAAPSAESKTPETAAQPEQIPGAEDKKDAGKPDKKKADKEKPEKESKIKEAVKSFTFRDYIRILQIVTERFLKKFRCEVLILHAAIGGEDAMKVATEYGTVNALLYPVLGALSAGGYLKKADVQITPDFASEETRAEGRAVFSIRLIHSLFSVIALYKELL